MGGLRISRSIYIAVTRGGRQLCRNIRIRRISRPGRVEARSSANSFLDARRIGRCAMLSGGGDVLGATQVSTDRKQNPPTWTGASLYSSDGPNYAPAFPDGGVVGQADGPGYSCIIRRIEQILRDDQGGPKDSSSEARCAAVRQALVSKYGSDPHAELEIHQRWRLIIEEPGCDPGDWNIVCWTGANAEGAESVGSGGKCARLRHSPGKPGHFVPVWSEFPAPLRRLR